MTLNRKTIAELFTFFNAWSELVEVPADRWDRVASCGHAPPISYEWNGPEDSVECAAILTQIPLEAWQGTHTNRVIFCGKCPACAKLYYRIGPPAIGTAL